MSDEFDFEMSAEFIKADLKEIGERLTHILRKLDIGCGNFGCLIKAPIGQGTNGACKCHPQRIREELVRVCILLNGARGWKKEDKTP